MAVVASRAARAGQFLGSRLVRASAIPLPFVPAAPADPAMRSQRNYGAVPSPEDSRLVGIRTKDLTFAAVTAFVGAAACYTAWYAGVSTRLVHFEAGKHAALNPDGWTHFKVAETRQLNHNTKLFRFSFDDPGLVSGLNVASCVLTRAPIGNAGKDGKPNYVIRPYTPVTSPDVKGYFDLVVKIYPEGKMTQHLARLTVGETLEVKGPIPKIPYTPNMKKNIGMVAGGTGITPMYQVIDEILSNPTDRTQISLLYANTTPNDILLKRELDELAQLHPNFKVHYIVSNPTDDWVGGVGFTDFDKIIKGLPNPADDTLIMVCGPPGLMNAISGDKASAKDQGELKGLLKQAGYVAQQVFKF